MCAHNEFPTFKFALPPKIGERLILFMSNNGIIYVKRTGESGLQNCGLTSTSQPHYPHYDPCGEFCALKWGSALSILYNNI